MSKKDREPRDNRESRDDRHRSSKKHSKHDNDRHDTRHDSDRRDSDRHRHKSRKRDRPDSPSRRRRRSSSRERQESRKSSSKSSRRDRRHRKDGEPPHSSHKEVHSKARERSLSPGEVLDDESSAESKGGSHDRKPSRSPKREQKRARFDSNSTGGRSRSRSPTNGRHSKRSGNGSPKQNEESDFADIMDMSADDEERRIQERRAQRAARLAALKQQVSDAAKKDISGTAEKPPRSALPTPSTSPIPSLEKPLQASAAHVGTGSPGGATSGDGLGVWCSSEGTDVNAADVEEDEAERVRQLKDVDGKLGKEEPKATPEEYDMFAAATACTDDAMVQVAPMSKNTAQVDDADDPDGYYLPRIGETLDGRYKVFGSVGRGVFSSVLLAEDVRKAGDRVCIKVIRSNDIMLRAGKREIEILHRLSKADQEDKSNCVRLIRHFEHRKHLCLVFEPMARNLREVLKKYGAGVGLHIKAVQAYARQMLVSLRHLQRCSVIHADIKLDNLLVAENNARVKLCDFGSASLATDCEITPYLVSRFYRAPEIVLGCPYDYAIDLWSVACCLYELYTGKIMYPGKTNNGMLRLFMEVKGPFSKKMLKRATCRETHFDDDGLFLYHHIDPGTKKDSVKKIRVDKPTKSLKQMLILTSQKLTEDERRMVGDLADFLEKCFTLDPSQRISLADAMRHPFILK